MSNLSLLSVECELLHLNELLSVTYLLYGHCPEKNESPLSIFNVTFPLYENLSIHQRRLAGKKLKGLAIFCKYFEF